MKKDKVVDDNKSSYTAQLAAKMVENIQIFIENIHIRYEDDRDPLHPFACGVAVESATATSTNHLFEPIDKPEKGSKLIYKVEIFGKYILYV